MEKLWKPQREATAKIRSFLEREPSWELVVMATGSGKTHVAASAIEQAVEVFGHGAPILFLVHRRELVHQAVTRIRALCPTLSIGVEMSSAKALETCSVVVASVQTIGRTNSQRLSWLKPKLVIVDEAHHTPARTYKTAIDRVTAEEPAHVLGFTATPYRQGDIPLFGDEKALFRGIIYSYGIRQGIKDKILCDLRGWTVETGIDAKRVRIRYGDFDEKELAQVVEVETRTAAAFKVWLDKASDRATIAFCVSVSHAESVANFWRTQGKTAQVILGTTPNDERDRIIADFKAGRLNVLVGVGVVTEGFDAPNTGCLLLLRPTKSWTLYCQMLGRGTRGENACPGKKDCLVIDLVDATDKMDVCSLPALIGIQVRANLNGASIARSLEVAEGLQYQGLDALPEFTICDLPATASGREIRNRRHPSISRLEGKRFGYLTVLALAGISAGKWPVPMLTCLCDCGNLVVASSKTLSKPRSVGMSCGCRPNPRTDLAGKRYGRLHVVGIAGRSGQGMTLWDCQCDCGQSKTVRSSTLVNGTTRSCGCLQRDTVAALAKSRPQHKDLSGRVFGRLTVLSLILDKKTAGATWLCSCSCGNQAIARATNLTSGYKKSCGCLRREVPAKRMKDRFAPNQ